MVKVSTLVAGAGFGVAYAAAAPAELAKRDDCTFTDAASAISGKAKCATITLNSIAVPAGTTLDLTGLQAGTSVIFQGNTTFGHKQWEGPLISVSGTNIQVSGSPGHTIDGNGSAWWDGEGSNSKTNRKPKFFYAHNLKGSSSIKGLHVKNTPVQGFSIDGSSGLILDSITIDNSAGASLGHNTDGFDIGDSSNITISNSNITNQDDCLAVNSGTNIKFFDNTCIGGHGISIGSVGGRSNNVVNGVTVQNCIVQDSDNGVRIKTVSGANGSVTAVTYDGVVLSNIAKFGLVIEQDYENGKPTGIPTAGVPITNLTLHNITGTVKSSGTNKYILCAAGACSSWTTSLIDIHGGKTSTACQGIPSDSGITC